MGVRIVGVRRGCGLCNVYFFLTAKKYPLTRKSVTYLHFPAWQAKNVTKEIARLSYRAHLAANQ